MQTYTMNPPSRAIPPRPALLPSEGYLRRSSGATSRLERLERVIRASGISASRIGRLLANDPALLINLRAGRTPRPRTLARIDAWIAGREATHA